MIFEIDTLESTPVKVPHYSCNKEKERKYVGEETGSTSGKGYRCPCA
jgi:hypothetical protein